MFPGQFGNANKCLRASSVSNGYTGTFTVTGGSNPCNYFVFYSNSSSGSITWDKGIGNVQYALVGGGGGGYGYTDIINTAGGGGSGGAVVVGQSQDPNLNGDIISVNNNNLTQSFTVGAGGIAITQAADSGGSTTWNGRTATGGAAGYGPFAATSSGGSGSGGAAVGAKGGVGTFVYLLLQDPNASTFPASAYNPITNTIGNSLAFSYPKYGSGGGGGDTVRRANTAAYNNQGGDYGGGFGMLWPTGDSLYSPATGSSGGGGGGGGTISSGGTYVRNGASGGTGLIILRTQYQEVSNG